MLSRFTRYYKPHRKLMVFVLTIVSFYALIELSIPIFTRYILNVLIPAGNLNKIMLVAGILVIILIAYAFFHYVVGYYGHMLGVSIESDMRLRAFKKLQELGFDYFDTNRTGVIMSRLTADLHEVSELAHHGVEELVAVSIMLVLGYGYLIQLDFWVTTILFVVFVGLLLLLVYTRRNMIVSFRKQRREHAAIYSRLEGTINGIRLTRAFANEDYEIEKFRLDNERYIDAYGGAYKALGSTNAITQFFAQFMNVAVLVAGAFLVLNNTFTLGDMFAYFLYFNMLIGPIKRLMTMLETFQQGWAGFERYEALLAEKSSIVDRDKAIVLNDARGDIELVDVSFAYNNSDEGVLNHFSLKIEAGKMVALVGPSGVGKTTIAQLIPRFYEVQAGAIHIDGVDVRDYTLNSLRKEIGYVQQDVVIFWGTIRENIAYGDPKADFAAIEKAAKQAGIHDFIMSMPMGYETLVGERGVTLSGGQKQRLSIARVFLKNPKILILDEATSALDNITESAIQKSFEELAVGRTVVVVAHRLSTIHNADLIVVMDETGISQSGTHETLMNEPGHYRDLVEASEKQRILEGFDLI